MPVLSTSPMDMEPLIIPEGSKHRGPLEDLAIDLAKKSSSFSASLPAGIVRPLSDTVRSMNCYYSNLIEGHNTHPLDIERALKKDYSKEKGRRDLQREAEAHIAVQAWIDEGGLTGRTTTAKGLCEIHERFCSLLPDDLLWVEYPETGERVRVVPGQIRERDVEVARHIAPSFEALSTFMERFDHVYSRLGTTGAIINAGPAHHRLLWIHPFLDGNGRVARLMSHALLLDRLETGSLWSVSRGLARNESRYKSQLEACDLGRRNNLDGRGPLSEETLAEFSKFFLETCIDQVDFMERLMAPKRLLARLQLWAEEEERVGAVPEKSGALLEAVLYRGSLPRGQAKEVLNLKDRQARRIVSALCETGVLMSDSPKGALKLAFPAKLAPRLVPGLFPDW